jgi:hypothetical protein
MPAGCARFEQEARAAGQLLLVNATAQAQVEPIRVVLNWAAALRK